VSDTIRPSAPLPVLELGGYRVRLAVDGEELREAQRLRFEVFHEELGEGLAGAAALGLDADRFDAHCEHLLLCEAATGTVVGTYRLQTAERAAAGEGFYCDGEFVLADLPAAVLDAGLELGRACVARAHRQSPALFALWRGIAARLGALGKRYVFGCCSLTGADEGLAATASAWLGAEGHLDPVCRARVRPSMAVDGRAAARGKAFRPPALFATYLRFGARVCGGPALDREFGTTDFLVLLDTDRLTPRQRAMFFTGP
jgi:putative hemolysin